MNVVIDIGNTRTKYALFNGQVLVEAGYNIGKIFESLQLLKDSGERVDVFLSGSGKLGEPVKLALKKKGGYLAGSLSGNAFADPDRLCNPRNFRVRPDCQLRGRNIAFCRTSVAGDRFGDGHYL